MAETTVTRNRKQALSSSSVAALTIEISDLMNRNAELRSSGRNQITGSTRTVATFASATALPAMPADLNKVGAVMAKGAVPGEIRDKSKD